ncbi:MAG: nodulation protein NfeD [Deltaproteobacteria bacterium]|nr:nodulation protein NfeD [Deltaproteobacteria bacterium]
MERTTVCGVLLVAGVSAFLTALPAPAAGAVHKLVLDAPINAIQVEYIKRGMEQADSEKSDMVLVVLNTPGGLGDAMQEIISLILSSRIPVCTWVHPPGGHAASAGFFILVSADVAAMSPGTRTGSAHPIMSIGGLFPIDAPGGTPAKERATPTDETVPEDREPDATAPDKSQAAILMDKVREDFQAYLRAITARRGRDSRAAELAVTESRSYTDQEALEHRLVDLIATTETELLDKLHGREVHMLDGSTRVLDTRGAPVTEIVRTFREEALVFLTNPNVAFLLFLVGALLIYIEVTHAGMVAPGVVGGILLLLAVMGFSFLPINATGVILMVAAIGLFVAEVMIQGFGIFGLAGVVCLALGGIMLVDLPEEGLQVDPWLAVATAVSFGAISLFLMGLAVRAFRRKAVTGAEGLIGLTGRAMSDLDPRGKVFIRGEYWDAVADTPIAKGGELYCRGIDGLILQVSPVAGDGDAPGEPTSTTSPDNE